MPPPAAWYDLLLAKRLSVSVFDLQEAPTDTVLLYRELFHVEGEMQQALAGLSPEEPLIFEDDEDD